MTQLGGHPSSLFQKIQKQRELKELCDVVLKVETAEFPAHKTVLAACSDYFHKMFTEDMTQTFSKVVVINGFSADTIKNILTCIYTGKIELRLDNIYDVLYAASFMQLTHILDEITRHINDMLLNAENACFFRYLAIRFPLNSLEIYVHEFFLNNFEKVSSQLDFLSLEFDTIRKIICSDKLVIKEEMKAFDFLINWVKKDIVGRKEQFSELFKLLRLQFIPIKYVVDKIQNNPIVRESHVCRNVVDEMIRYYFFPCASKTQKPRNSFVPQPDSVMFLPFRRKFQYIYNYVKDQSFQEIIFDGITHETILEETAIATKYPVSVFCGGKSAFNEATRKSVRFDGVKWMDFPPMNEPRCSAAAVFFEDDLLVFGGEIYPISSAATFSFGQSNSDSCNFSRTFEKFNTEWISYDFSFSPRSHFAALTVNRKIYFIGGYMPTSSNNPDPASLNTGYNTVPEYLCKYTSKETLILEPYTSSLEKIGNLNEARASFSSIVVNSTIYVVGGVGRFGNNLISIESLEISQHRWTNITLCDYQLGPCTAFPSADNNKLWIFSQHQESLLYYDIKSKMLHSFLAKNSKGIIIPFCIKYDIYPCNQVNASPSLCYSST